MFESIYLISTIPLLKGNQNSVLGTCSQTDLLANPASIRHLVQGLYEPQFPLLRCLVFQSPRLWLPVSALRFCFHSVKVLLERCIFKDAQKSHAGQLGPPAEVPSRRTQT